MFTKQVQSSSHAHVHAYKQARQADIILSRIVFVQKWADTCAQVCLSSTIVDDGTWTEREKKKVGSQSLQHQDPHLRQGSSGC